MAVGLTAALGALALVLAPRAGAAAATPQARGQAPAQTQAQAQARGQDQAPAQTPTTNAGPLPLSSSSPVIITGHIDVVQVNGLLDPIQVDFLRHAVAGAGREQATALLVVLNSGGGVASHSQIDGLVRAIDSSSVPVAVWVGPNGSRALGDAYLIFQAAALRGMSPGTRVGNDPRGGPLAHRTVGTGDAAAAGLTTNVHLNQPDLGDFVVNMDGLSVDGRQLQTAREVTENGQQRRQPTVDVRFQKLSLVEQLLHTAASPSVAYLMLLIGLLCLAMDFFTGGVGIGTACGAAALTLASYGLGILPIRIWALLLIGVAAFGFCVDLQAGVPRAWTAIGSACLLAGSLWLYHGVHISWLGLAFGVLGTPLFMVAGLPALVRTRFSTPTIGRQSLVGELGVALSSVQPEGTVQVRGAPWRARTNRATPIAGGDRIRVVSIDGLMLEVEPETGAAREAHH